MKIFVKAKPNSKFAKLEKTDEIHFTIYVKEPAKENKANFAIIESLAKYFGVSLSHVRLVSGNTSKQKVFEIL